MLGKGYFFVLLTFSLFALYYQSITEGFSLNLGMLGQLANLILLFGGYAYYFNREILTQEYWKYLYYFVLANLLLGFFIAVLPGSYSGDFSLLNANLITNLFVVLLGLAIFSPFYIILYKLAFLKTKKAKKK